MRDVDDDLFKSTEGLYVIKGCAQVGIPESEAIGTRSSDPQTRQTYFVLGYGITIVKSGKRT